ncbi:ribonuclease family protein [Yersinia ruckeri]|uniref:ribonuclease domain-containing protein n=1 Tax=Yersinia ruckeri TaxID=29486 RepID=UPI0005ACCBBC|nr:ribonuclease domain-containing protein [Yersinia ruckeri]AJI95287.1 ribonuclease family protein [Yersinia ruckeri]MCW6567814.1 ribonuclease [Yersinia ruckeri]
MNKRLLGILAVALVFIVAAIQGNERGSTPNNERIATKTNQHAGQSDADSHNQAGSIDQLTQHDKVSKYIKQNNKLPDFYITKKQAREQGWNPKDGNLCQVLPGKAIGGDRFSNREGTLPKADKRIWREADVNYQCGHRGTDRLLYSNDGQIYLTRDHYKHFVRME